MKAAVKHQTTMAEMRGRETAEAVKGKVDAVGAANCGAFACAHAIARPTSCVTTAKLGTLVRHSAATTQGWHTMDQSQPTTGVLRQNSRSACRA